MLKKIKFLFLIFSFIIVISFTFKTNTVINVNASGNYNEVSFNYINTKYVNTESLVMNEEQNVDKAKVYDSYGKETILQVIMYTNKEENNNQIQNNSYIKSTIISIEVISNYENYKLYLYDSFNNEIASTGSNLLTLDELVDDTYYFKAYLDGPGNLVDNRTYELYKTEIDFSFTIDTLPPIINGASIYMDGVCTSSLIEVEGIDEGSGIKALYMLEANGDSYQNIGTSIKFSSSSEGYITFYAIDNIGNRSKLYYIYNDITKPKGSIYDINGNIINNSFTESSFYYQAKDSGSGIDYLQYKTPSNTDFIIYEGQTISNILENGLYEFRSVDKAGNISEITKINLYKTNSIVEIINIPNSNKVYLTWGSDQYQVFINGRSYIKNTIIEDEGEYFVNIINEIGISSNISFNISCYYKFIDEIKPTCINEGYKIYRCISCNNELKTDIKNKTLIHSYIIDYLDSTCNNNGGIINKCIYCSKYFYIIKKEKLYHNYEAVILTPPTCIDMGERLLVCKYCNQEKIEQVPKLNHSFIILDELEEDNSITKIYTCTNCNTIETTSYDTKEKEIIKAVDEILNAYFKYMVSILLLTSLIWSLYIGIKTILSYKLEERINVKKMIINYVIGLVVIFVIIVAIPYLLKGVINIF